jgi:phosphohistidine phosphatase SixA
MTHTQHRNRIKIIFIRHGEREYNDFRADKEMPLSKEGKRQITDLAERFQYLKVKPAIYFTSEYKHAQDTAGLLIQMLGGCQKTCSTLTPKAKEETQITNGIRETPENIFWRLLEEINGDKETKLYLADEKKQEKVIAFVGHEARLSQLLTCLTSKRHRPFNRAEALCVAAHSLPDFIGGQGQIEFRIPVVDYQEDKLRDKIHSKMSVSTFLAGFTFTALIELLKEPRDLDSSRMAAAICLTWALALFVAAVYMYDRLGMPEGFWAYGNRPKLQRKFQRLRSRKFEEDYRNHGPLYAYMVWTWKRVFTPAVAIALLGFIMILLSTWSIVIWGGLIALTVVILYYFIARPLLGTD